MSVTDIATRFSNAVEDFPENTALWSSEGSISYRELDEKASALARWLLEHRRTKKAVVGIMLPKTIDAIVSILGCIKANIPYAPVDPSWPARRRDSIVRQAGFDIVMAGPDVATQLDNFNTMLIPASDTWEQATAPVAGAPSFQASRAPEDLAYILFTSGSTGEPKGVCVSSRAAFFFPDWARREFSVGATDRIASVAPLTFDLSTFDLFATLGGGGTVYLVPDAVKMLPSSLARFLEQHRITAIYAVPSNLGLLVSRGGLENRDLTALRTVLFAGEVMPLPLFHELKSKLPAEVRYANLYGPTETNVCTWFDMRHIDESDKSIPIGLPLPETCAFALTQDGSLAAPGEEGELCIAGPTVMSRYWGAAGERADIWATPPGESRATAYRTGDYAKMRGDGNWLYFGRRDGMVKIWGYRVELGEVESCLLTYDGIEQAAVVKVAAQGKLGDQLVAFVVGSEASRDSADAKIIRYCRENLPPYMCPGVVHFIDDIPLSHNGKIQRRELTERATRLVAGDQ